MHNMEFKPKLARCDLRLSRLDFHIRIIWIHEHANHGDIWNQLAQKLQPLSPHLYVQRGRARGVATRPIQTSDQSELDWVVPHVEAAQQRDEIAAFQVEHGDFLPYALLARQPTRALGFPAPQPATERRASPWGRPELF